MKARVFLSLLTLPVLLLTSCERGYDLSFGEALTIYNDIATDIGKNNAASYKLGGYSYVGNSLALDIDYAAFRIPNDFIVGYGLDYDQQGRQLPDIYTLKGE